MNENERLELLFKLKRHKVKMKDVAEALDVSASLLSQYLNSKCNMSLDNENELLKFIDALDAKN